MEFGSICILISKCYLVWTHIVQKSLQTTPHAHILLNIMQRKHSLIYNMYMFISALNFLLTKRGSLSRWLFYKSFNELSQNAVIELKYNSYFDDEFSSVCINCCLVCLSRGCPCMLVLSQTHLYSRPFVSLASISKW